MLLRSLRKVWKRIFTTRISSSLMCHIISWHVQVPLMHFPCSTTHEPVSEASICSWDWDGSLIRDIPLQISRSDEPEFLLILKWTYDDSGIDSGISICSSELVVMRNNHHWSFLIIAKPNSCNKRIIVSWSLVSPLLTSLLLACRPDK